MIFSVSASLSDTCGNTELVHVAYVQAASEADVYKMYPPVDGFLGFYVEPLQVESLPSKPLTRAECKAFFDRYFG